MGSRRAVVTSGWRYRRRMRSAMHPALLVLTLGGVVAAGAVAAVLSVPTLTGARASGPGGDFPRQLALLLGVPWMVLGALALPLLVRAVPDLVRRRVVEGTVVRVRTPVGRRSWTRGDEAMDRFDKLFLAVDDGGAGDLVAYPLGRVRPGRMSATAFDDVASGDHARVTVTPGFGHVVAVEVVHDRHDRPVRPAVAAAAASPAPPDCPLTPTDVAEAYATGVRRCEERTHDATNRWWAFELVADTDVEVRLFAIGPGGLAAVLATAKAYDPRPGRRSGTATVTRYAGVPGSLLVVEDRGHCVALQRTSTVDTSLETVTADLRLAHLALDRLARPGGRRGRRRRR